MYYKSSFAYKMCGDALKKVPSENEKLKKLVDMGRHTAQEVVEKSFTDKTLAALMLSQ